MGSLCSKKDNCKLLTFISFLILIIWTLEFAKSNKPVLSKAES